MFVRPHYKKQTKPKTEKNLQKKKLERQKHTEDKKRKKKKKTKKTPEKKERKGKIRLQDGALPPSGCGNVCGSHGVERR